MIQRKNLVEKKQDLQIFEFEGSKIRTIDINGERWLCGSDVCDILGYSNASRAIQQHCSTDEKHYTKLYSPNDNTTQIYINEPNMYRLINKSSSPEAKKFQEWLLQKVLHSIVKTGSYSIPTTIPVQLPNYQQALRQLADKIDENEKQAAQLLIAAPKVEIYDKIASGENLQTMNQVAKEIGWGRNKLFDHLRQKKVLMANNLPYQNFIDDGYFVVKLSQSRWVKSKTTSLRHS
jgi:prophage antirepressor-like protein